MNKLKEYWEILAIVVGMLGLLGIEFSKIKIRPFTWLIKIITLIFIPLKRYVLNETTKALEQKCEWGKLYREDREKIYELEMKYKIIEIKNNNVENGMLAMLGDRIVASCILHIKNEEIKDSQLKTLMLLHKAYKDLGGNSFVDEMMEKVKKVKVV